MKRLHLSTRLPLLALLACLLLPLASRAQEPYLGLRIQGGTRPVEALQGFWQLYYYEEGFGELLYSERNSRNTVRPLGFGAIIEGGVMGGYHLEAGVDFAISSPGNFAITAGAGFNLALGDVQLRPKALFVAGMTTLSFGREPNTPSGIVVDGTWFDVWDFIDLRMNEWFLAARPGLEITIPISDRIWLTAGAAYQFELHRFTPVLVLRGRPDQFDDSPTEHELLSDINVELYYDGEQIDRMPVEIEGLVANFGLTFRFD